MDFIMQIFSEIAKTAVISILIYFFRKPIINLGKKLLGHFFDKRIYKEAARDEPVKTIDSIFEFMTLMLSIWFLIAGFNNWSRLSTLNKKAEISEKMALENKGLKDCDECSPVKVMKNAKELQNEVYKEKFNATLFIILSIALMLNNAIKIIRRAIVYEMLVDFKQVMNKIRPYIEEKEFYQLNSAWAYMENAQDYQSIKERIKTIESVLIKNQRNM